MLHRLSVENYALIDKLEMELSPSLNIITGETGAGKSILLGALGLLLGNRAESGVVKDPLRNCNVEGVFEIGDYNLKPFFEQNDLDYDSRTVVRRTINTAGKSRAYINDLPVQLSTLKEFVSQLVDIHSQHQTLMIADEAFRLGVLDGIAANSQIRSKYQTAFESLKYAEKELMQLRERKAIAERDLEWLTYQTEELSSAKLKAGEQEELESELRELTNSDEIRSALGGGAELLGAEEGGVLVSLKNIAHSFDKIKSVYNGAIDISQRVNSAFLELKDIEAELAQACEKMEFNPQRLETVELRLNMLYSLEQKHKVTSEAELIALFEDYKTKLDSIIGGDEAIKELEQKVEGYKATAISIAEKISASRVKAATTVKSHTEAMLAELGIPNGVMNFDLERSNQLRSSGQDDVKILFSANKNIAPQPIEKSASGGELSRVMLAIKSLVAKSSKLPTIIFDEIDTGVSGKIADKMGEIIHDLSGNMQVVNITHLPQVASKGDTHWYVYKEDSSATTTTHVEKLSAEQRIKEIANMISGSAVSAAAIEQAKHLLNKK